MIVALMAMAAFARTYSHEESLIRVLDAMEKRREEAVPTPSEGHWFYPPPIEPVEEVTTHKFVLTGKGNVCRMDELDGNGWFTVTIKGGRCEFGDDQYLIGDQLVIPYGAARRPNKWRNVLRGVVALRSDGLWSIGQYNGRKVNFPALVSVVDEQGNWIRIIDSIRLGAATDAELESRQKLIFTDRQGRRAYFNPHRGRFE